MGKIRVHELSRELELTSKDVLAELARMGEHVRSASSVIEGSVADHVRREIARPDYRRADQPPPRSRLLPARTPPSGQVTAAEASRVVGVKAATVRQWVARGHLKRVGWRGRSALYDRAELVRAWEGARVRTRQAPPDAALELPATYDARRITVAEAAALMGVAPSTVRSWITRGRVTPVGREGHAHLLTVRSVRDAARRNPSYP